MVGKIILTRNNNKYTIKTIKKSEIYIKNNLKNNLNNIKGVVFDCDGVLIDARLSYDLAIKNTISLILGNLISKKLDSMIIPNQIIEKLRETDYPNIYYSTKGAHEYVSPLVAENSSNAVAGFTPLTKPSSKKFIKKIEL